mgnify:CR=1 FL=1
MIEDIRSILEKKLSHALDNLAYPFLTLDKITETCDSLIFEVNDSLIGHKITAQAPLPNGLSEVTKHDISDIIFSLKEGFVKRTEETFGKLQISVNTMEILEMAYERGLPVKPFHRDLTFTYEIAGFPSTSKCSEVLLISASKTKRFMVVPSLFRWKSWATKAFATKSAENKKFEVFDLKDLLLDVYGSMRFIPKEVLMFFYNLMILEGVN